MFKMYAVFILIRNWCFEDLTFMISILINILFLKLYELSLIFIRVIQFLKILNYNLKFNGLWFRIWDNSSKSIF